MTAPQTPRPPPGLRVDLGHPTRPWSRDGGRWIRQPTADYRCGRCGFTDSASGPEAVQRFANTIHRTHRAECPHA